MDHPEITHVSLCAGYGGIDLGLHRCLPNLRTIAYSEIEAFACELLLARMEGGQIDAAPIWPDLKSFPWEKLRDRVDILSGGYPCQPFSSAGKRLGREDPRHLWPYIADGISILRPRLCFFENVEGHISLGLREVIEHLGRLGYSTTWGIFSAAEVGAPHQRKRVFILAHRIISGLEGIKRGIILSQKWEESGRSTASRGRDGKSGNLADSLCDGSAESRILCQGSNGQFPICDGNARRDVWPSRPGHPSSDGSRPASWATPRTGKTTDENPETWAKRQAEGKVATMPLTAQVKVWATPRAEHDSGRHRGQPDTLHSQIKAWGTPNARDWMGAPGQGCQERGGHRASLPGQIKKTENSGKLNPRWVETLMGLPVGWTMPSCASPVIPESTSCASSETASSPQSPSEPS